MEKIIIGTRLMDTWGNQWYVIGKDAKGYNLRSVKYPTTDHFLTEEIKKWKIISR